MKNKLLHFLKNILINLAFFTAIGAPNGKLIAAQKMSHHSKAYSKKPPYAGYGKQSKINGLPKSKIVSGHAKKTNKGYTYVNPYARSK